MRILVSGATGFVGSQLCQALFEKGHDLHVLSRSAQSVGARLSVPVKAFEWGKGDQDGQVPRAALEGVEAVVHLAGEGVADRRWSAHQKHRILASRVITTEALVQAMRQAKQAGSPLRSWVCASAIGYYGQSRDDEWIDESTPRGTGFLSEVCQKWEDASGAAELTALGVECKTARLGIVLGETGGALARLLPLYRAGVGGPIGEGRFWQSWIHEKDAVGALAFLAESVGLKGVFNLVAPNPVLQREFSRELAQAARAPFEIPTPAFALKMAFGEMAREVLLASQRVRSERLTRAGYVWKFSHLKEALKESVGPFDLQGSLRFRAYQWVPRTIDTVFPFFSEAKNLEAITPEFLNFKIKKQSTPDVREGTLIDYRLKIHGVPAGWRTRIDVWEPGKRFVDTQLKGPYSKWYHTHDFEPLRGGTMLTDTVLYRLPFGRLGEIFAGAFVKKDVGQIFAHRRKVIAERFGDRSEAN